MRSASEENMFACTSVQHERVVTTATRRSQSSDVTDRGQHESNNRNQSSRLDFPHRDRRHLEFCRHVAAGTAHIEMSAVTSAGPASCEHAEGSDTTGQHKRKLSEASDAVETVKTENREGAPKKKTKRPYEPHERFWLQDGNVVVHLDGVGFKLHRSRLASQSPWFKALFDKRAGFDPPADNTFPDFRDIPVEVEDGCDVYDLHATYVSSEDFAALLAAMEDAV